MSMEVKQVLRDLGAPVVERVWEHSGDILALTAEGDLIVLAVLKQSEEVAKVPRTRIKKIDGGKIESISKGEQKNAAHGMD